MDEKVETTSFGDMMAETSVHVHNQEGKEISTKDGSSASYKPLDEIDLTRDFRTSLILNQFEVSNDSNLEEAPRQQPSPELPESVASEQPTAAENLPVAQLPVSPQQEKVQLDDFAPLPVPSPVPASIEDVKPAVPHEGGAPPPPLSPTSSVTSNSVRNSGGNGSSNTDESTTAESEKVQYTEDSNDANTSATPVPVPAPPNNDHKTPAVTNTSVATPASTGWRPLQAALSSFGSTRQSSRKKIRDPSERVKRTSL